MMPDMVKSPEVGADNLSTEVGDPSTLVNTQAVKREFPFTDRDFATLSDLIHQKTGIVLKDHKRNLMYSRLARRLRALGIRSFADYLHYLAGPRGDTELTGLINAMTTNLTKFFREPHHFTFLEEQLATLIGDKIAKGEQRLRLWSAGCSSGEEPYSIAMVLKHILDSYSDVEFDAKILATDLDTAMLEHGRTGRYREEYVTSIDEKYNRFYASENHPKPVLKMSPYLRQLISFKKLNLLDDWPVRGPFDFIFCRNVMIYFDNPTKRKMVERLTDKLAVGGHLFIGHSETILNTPNSPLKLLGRTIYQRVS